MLIELKITAETPAEYWNALRGLLSTTALPVAENTTVAATEASVTATTAGSKKRKPAPEVETAKPAEPEQNAEVEQSASEDEPELPLTETVDEKPEPLKLTNDLVKAFAVRHVNDRVVSANIVGTTEQQSHGRKIFQDLLKEFGATKFSEIPDDKLGDVHDRIMAERAKAGMAKLDIAELAASLAAK